MRRRQPLQKMRQSLYQPRPQGLARPFGQTYRGHGRPWCRFRICSPQFHFRPFGFYGYIVFFFVFSAIGKGMQRVASYKQGPKVFVGALLGLTSGLAIGPFREMFLATINAGNEAGGVPDAQSPLLMQAAIFVCAVLWPFARKN
jgi:hypothetical protein